MLAKLNMKCRDAARSHFLTLFRAKLHFRLWERSFYTTCRHVDIS
jgi:hypothetical protein